MKDTLRDRDKGSDRLPAVIFCVGMACFVSVVLIFGFYDLPSPLGYERQQGCLCNDIKKTLGGADTKVEYFEHERTTRGVETTIVWR